MARVANSVRRTAIFFRDQIPADAKERPVQLVDDAGKPILDEQGKPILRPAHLDPKMFIRQGQVIKDELDSAMNENPDALVGDLVSLGVQLFHFKQGHEWDAQRIDGKNVVEYQDYATIAIGLYSAAAGIPIDQILSAQDQYAADNSHFSQNAKMDDHYKHLREKNVKNTQLGYDLYQSGRIRER